MWGAILVIFPVMWLGLVDFIGKLILLLVYKHLVGKAMEFSDYFTSTRVGFPIFSYLDTLKLTLYRKNLVTLTLNIQQFVLD